MTSNYKHPPHDIDLNIEYIQSSIEDGNTQTEIYNHLLDLNIDATDDFVIDHNVVPSSPMNGMFASTQLVLDLNQEPGAF